MGDVRYVDSGGIGELAESFTSARHRGGSITLLNLFACFETEEEALDSFDRPLVAH